MNDLAESIRKWGALMTLFAGLGVGVILRSWGVTEALLMLIATTGLLISVWKVSILFEKEKIKKKG